MLTILDKTIIKRVLLFDLLSEYLTSKGYLIERVYNYSNKNWWVNLVSYQSPINFQIIDKLGVNKESFSYLKQIDVILISFIPRSIIFSWFDSLTKIQQKKVYFLFNEQTKNEKQQNKSNKNKTELKTDSRITIALNIDLIEQAEKFLQNKWEKSDYTYSSLSALIRASLRAYQQGQLALDEQVRFRHSTKRYTNLRLDSDLLDFYNSLPFGNRIAIAERSLSAFLVQF